MVTGSLRFLAVLFSIPFLIQSAAAQDRQPTQFQVRTKEKTISPAEIVRRFEAPEMSSYTLGKGDEISIEVWNHAELSGKHVIGPDGKITLPVAGIISVADLTREDAQRTIATALGKFYSDLAVTLRVDRYTSYRIFVLGRVGTPGAIQFESQPTLLDVVTRAAILPIGGVNSDKTSLGRCAIIRGSDQMVWVDLKTLLGQGNLALNIRLARNDLVYLPDASDQLVYVLGEVQHPGAFRLTPEMSFLDAFAQAGGLNEDAAQDKVEIVRGATGKNQEFRLKDLLSKPRELNFSLEDGDILYVPRRTLSKFGYILQKAGPLAGFAVFGTVATH